MNKEIKLPVRKYQVGAAVALGSALATLAGGAGAYYGSKELKDLIESGNLSGAASYIKDKTSNLFSGAKAMTYSDLARIMKAKDDFSSLFSLSGYNPSVLYDEATKQAGESTTARRRGRPRKNQGSTTGEAAGETAATVPATTETAPTDSASVAAPAITGQASSDSTRTQPATPRQPEEQEPEVNPEPSKPRPKKPRQNLKKQVEDLKKQIEELKQARKNRVLRNIGPKYESMKIPWGKIALGIGIPAATIPGVSYYLGRGVRTVGNNLGGFMEGFTGEQPEKQPGKQQTNQTVNPDTLVSYPNYPYMIKEGLFDYD